MRLQLRPQPEHNAFTRARVREHMAALVQHEHEKRLAVDLGLPRAGFWAANKSRGGPVHFWLRITPTSDLYNIACHQLTSAVERQDIGKGRDPVTAKRVCRTCRAMVLALDW